MFYTNAQVLGDKILLRGINDSGKPFKEKVNYSPTLFTNCIDESKYKDIYGKFCVATKFDSIKACNDWIESNKHSQIDILGMQDHSLAYIADNFPDKIDYDSSKVRIAFIDIEVYSPDEFPDATKSEYPIDALTMYDSISKKYYVFSTKKWNKEDSELDKTILDNVIYKECFTETDLLSSFLNKWKQNYPDAVTGWNSNLFDLVTIYKRMKLLLGETVAKTLSPWNMILERKSYDDHGNDSINLNIYGIAFLDYYSLYKKFTYEPRAFYNLNYIAQVELNETKLEFDMSHAELSDKQPQTYVDYNIKDVFLVNKLDEKLRLIMLSIGVAYDSHINYKDIFSPVKMWDAIIFNDVKKSKIVIPKVKSHERESFTGAYVKEVIPGFYKWVISFDAESLYTSILNQLNISPETIRNRADRFSIEDLINKNVILPNPDLTYAPNGMQYTREFKGVIPSVGHKVFEARKVHKKQQLEYERLSENSSNKEEKQRYKNLAIIEKVTQEAKKYAINSLYGALGNVYFRYYNLDNAEALTTSGQLIIRFIEKKLNEYFNKILKTDVDRCLAVDTDSNYFCVEDFVEKYMPNKTTQEKVELLDKFCKEKLSAYLDKSSKELADYVNAYENRIFFKREIIADSAFWRSSKKYAMNVWDKEGVRYKQPKIKAMGIESQQSSIPKLVQDAMKECTRIILQEDQQSLIKYIEDFEINFKGLPCDSVAPITSVNGIKKYSDKDGNPIKGAQAHVKGALAYLRIYKTGIKNGDKVSVLPLRVPNRFNSKHLAFPQSGIPSDIKEYVFSKVDHQELWEKVFFNSIKLTTDAIGWKCKDEVDLLSFFN